MKDKGKEGRGGGEREGEGRGKGGGREEEGKRVDGRESGGEEEGGGVRVRLNQVGLEIGLDWIGLDLDWIGLDRGGWIGLGLWTVAMSSSMVALGGGARVRCAAPGAMGGRHPAGRGGLVPLGAGPMGMLGRGVVPQQQARARGGVALSMGWALSAPTPGLAVARALGEGAGTAEGGEGGTEVAEKKYDPRLDDVSYENTWFDSSRRGNMTYIMEQLEMGRDPNLLDKKRRTALHYACGVNNVEMVQLLIEKGADVDAQDVEGFSPLHIAVGYARGPVTKLLLDADAEPELRDAKGKSVYALCEGLIRRAPVGNALDGEAQARKAGLEMCLKLIEEVIYEVAEVERLMDKRVSDTAQGRVTEYLVRWVDGGEGTGDTWEPAVSIGADVIEDYEDGYEFADVDALLDRRETPNGRVEYLVRWADGAEEWQPSEDLAEEEIAKFEGTSVEQVRADDQKRAAQREAADAKAE